MRKEIPAVPTKEEFEKQLRDTQQKLISERPELGDFDCVKLQHYNNYYACPLLSTIYQHRKKLTELGIDHLFYRHGRYVYVYAKRYYDWYIARQERHYHKSYRPRVGNFRYVSRAEYEAEESDK